VDDAKRPRQTSRGMTLGGHLCMCVVRQLGILSYSSTDPRAYSPPVKSGASLDRTGTLTCRLEP